MTLNDWLGASGNAAIRLKDQGTYDVAWEFLLSGSKEQVCVVVGDRYGLQNCLGNQGLVAARLGKLDEAMALHKERERICRAIGHRLGIAASLGNQALILCAHDLGGALALHYEEMQLCREIGDREGVARSLSNQAMIYEDMGKAEQALEFLCDSEHVSRELGSKVAHSKMPDGPGKNHSKKG